MSGGGLGGGTAVGGMNLSTPTASNGMGLGAPQTSGLTGLQGMMGGLAGNPQTQAIPPQWQQFLQQLQQQQSKQQQQGLGTGSGSLVGAGKGILGLLGML